MPVSYFSGERKGNRQTYAKKNKVKTRKSRQRLSTMQLKQVKKVINNNRSLGYVTGRITPLVLPNVATDALQTPQFIELTPTIEHINITGGLTDNDEFRLSNRVLLRSVEFNIAVFNRGNDATNTRILIVRADRVIAETDLAAFPIGTMTPEAVNSIVCDKLLYLGGDVDAAQNAGRVFQIRTKNNVRLDFDSVQDTKPGNHRWYLALYSEMADSSAAATGNINLTCHTRYQFLNEGTSK